MQTERRWNRLDSFPDRSALKAWAFWNGPEFPGASGRFDWQPGVNGDGWAVLRFDFTNGGNYVSAGRDLPADVQAGAIRLRVRNPNRNTLLLRVVDSSGQTFQKGFAVDESDWTRVTLRFDGWTGNWGGAADGVFKGRAVRIELGAENNGLQKQGHLDIDDLEWAPGEASGVLLAEELVVTRFRAPEAWNLRRGRWTYIGPARPDGVLTLDLQPGESLDIQNDLAIPGRPDQLTLVVRTSTAGIRLRAIIGSHFMFFMRDLGVTSGGGVQTFRAPMGSMQGWDYEHGANDGVPIYPLRLWSIQYVAEAPLQAEIEMVELRVNTRVQSAYAVELAPVSRTNNGAVRSECVVRRVAGPPEAGSLHWLVRSLDGRRLAQGRRSLPLRLGQASTQVATAPLGSARMALVEWHVESAGRRYGPVVQGACRPLPQQTSSRPVPESIWGMGVYLYRYPSQGAGKQRMVDAARAAQAAGVKWTREEFGWAGVSPEPGRYNWDHMDTVVETALAHGISVYGLISYWSSWAKAYTPEGIDQYAQYAYDLAARYRGRVDHWEIWNEPNIFFWSGPREMYADLLKAAYQAVKRANPRAVVLGCSTSGIDLPFIRMVMDRGAPFDELTIHPYRHHLNDDAFIRELQQVRDIVQRPVWITEMGWSTQLQTGVTELQQASLLSRCYLCAAASGAVLSISWYDLRDDGDNPFYNEHRFGVLRNPDLAPKPAYLALGAICNTLGTQTVQGRLPAPAGVQAWRFAEGGRHTVALWSAARDVRVQLKTVSDWRMVDMSGQTAVMPRRSSTATVDLRYGLPVLLTGGSGELKVERASALDGGVRELEF